jgi:hypothetical protein
VLSEGESLGGIFIKKINKSSVEIVAAGRVKIIELGQRID